MIFLGLAHVTDEAKRSALPISDERRLPTSVMYVYQNIVTRGPLGIRQTLLTMCGVNVTTTVSHLKTVPTKLEIIGDNPKVEAARALDGLIKKNWPLESKKDTRPYCLLQIIGHVQSDPPLAAFKTQITDVAFGFTADMITMAQINNGKFEWKD